MVKRVPSLTGFGRNGVSDFLIQRVSALIMLVYTIFLLGYYLVTPAIDYNAWHTLFSYTLMKIFTLLTIASLLAHAWIGMWTIFTDYIKIAALRGTLQILMILAFLGAFIWGVQILWG